MASIAREPDGRKRIQFVAPNGERRTIRLGRTSDKIASMVKGHVEHLVSALGNGGTPERHTALWLAEIPDPLHAKLARAGLVKPRERADDRLGAVLDAWERSLTVKRSTMVAYGQARDALLAYFGRERRANSITLRECDEWRQAMVDRELATATIAKNIKTARQAFKHGVRWGMLDANPFEGVKAGSMANPERWRFVTLAEAQAVLDACPDHEWRLLFALSRFGGLRCPSEHLALTWADVDWERGRIRVRSPKTEGQGKAERFVPLFPELREHLLASFEAAEPGVEHVITRYRMANCNLRTQLLRIIRRAGLTPWPRLFHNLRASRQTELAATYPAHVVAGWMGNSERVAAAHYLSIRDSDFAHACAAPTPEADKISGAKSGALPAQNAAQQAIAANCPDRNTRAQTPRKQGSNADPATHAAFLKTSQVAPVGVEPTRPFRGRGF